MMRMDGCCTFRAEMLPARDDPHVRPEDGRRLGAGVPWAALQWTLLMAVATFLRGLVLEPRSNSKHETHVAHSFALTASEASRVAELALVGHADIRRQLANELVPEPQSRIHVR